MHLSLGIFNRLWTLLGEACTELDLKLAECSGSGDNISAGESYSHYIALLKRRSLLRMEMETQQGYVKVMDQLVTYTALALPDADDTLTELQKEAVAAHKILDNMVYDCSSIVYTLT